MLVFFIASFVLASLLWAGLASCLYLAFFVFCCLACLGHLLLDSDVAGCLVLLAAGLFCTPGCLVGGLLIDGAGACMVWLGGLLFAWLVVWLCFTCFACFASRCDLPVLTLGWFCIAWRAFRIRCRFAHQAWPFWVQPVSCYLGNYLVLRISSLKMLYESSGGNQVDGLPPA